MMNRYAVQATLEAPLALKQSRQSERSETLSFVPGTTLRGALATSYLQIHGAVDHTFQTLFLDESRCRFGPLDPAPSVYPLTAVQCKRHPVDHPKSDHLIYRIIQHLLGGLAPGEIHGRFRVCQQPGCGADMKSCTGFHSDTEADAKAGHQLDTQVSAHVGIDRTTATAADGVFYTLKSLSPQRGMQGPHLVGWMEADDDAREAITGLLEEEAGVIYLGHHRTRGYGRVKLDIAGPDGDDASSHDRWQQWSDRAIEALQPDLQHSNGSAATLSSENDFIFTLSFPTGAVLVDRVLRNSLDPASSIDWLPRLPDPSKLFPFEERPATTIGGGQLRCLCAVTRPELLRGWNSAHGLPKQDEHAVARGAVYAYLFHGDASSREEVINRLEQLSQNGMGLRRNEGFGVVKVSDPFHLDALRREKVS
ncbi:MAG: CRISPR-associated RAMP protein Csx10 [Gemmatales bacterium]|nr:MAG: CRISPR-associated RAMP protein Csx10 [Gemmatales bacterium]